MYDPVKVLELAMEMELNGQEFLEKNADKCQNLQSQTLFEKISKVESDHYNYLKKLISKYNGEKLSDKDLELPEALADHFFEQKKENENLEQNLEQSMIPDMNILRMAYLIKEDFSQFYLDMAKNIEDDELKPILESFSNWEQQHAKLFKKEYDRLMGLYMNLSWGG